MCCSKTRAFLLVVLITGLIVSVVYNVYGEPAAIVADHHIAGDWEGDISAGGQPLPVIGR